MRIDTSKTYCLAYDRCAKGDTCDRALTPGISAAADLSFAVLRHYSGEQPCFEARP